MADSTIIEFSGRDTVCDRLSDLLRKLRGFAHLADVIEGVDFINGIKPSNTDQAAA